MKSFHSRFRDECLNREQFGTFTEARVVAEDLRSDYNTARSHSSIGYRSSKRFAEQLPPLILRSSRPTATLCEGSLTSATSTYQPTSRTNIASGPNPAPCRSFWPSAPNAAFHCAMGR